MKLIFCPHCHDIVRLKLGLRRCHCGKIAGRYIADGLHARISQDAIPIGFANSSFVEALNNRPESGRGKRFEAFVIPHECDTILVGEKWEKEIYSG